MSYRIFYSDLKGASDHFMKLYQEGTDIKMLTEIGTKYIRDFREWEKIFPGARLILPTDDHIQGLLDKLKDEKTI